MMPNHQLAGVAAGRTPEFIEMMQVGVNHNSGSVGSDLPRDPAAHSTGDAALYWLGCPGATFGLCAGSGYGRGAAGRAKSMGGQIANHRR